MMPYPNALTNAKTMMTRLRLGMFALVWRRGVARADTIPARRQQMSAPQAAEIPKARAFGHHQVTPGFSLCRFTVMRFLADFAACAPCPVLDRK
jgi:hypothetical protein